MRSRILLTSGAPALCWRALSAALPLVAHTRTELLVLVLAHLLPALLDHATHVALLSIIADVSFPADLSSPAT